MRQIDGDEDAGAPGQEGPSLLEFDMSRARRQYIVVISLGEMTALKHLAPRDRGTGKLPLALPNRQP
jgi:hypothetical protein